jgi:activator of 2-hydroxyglutaryl-CoA dehydratase
LAFLVMSGDVAKNQGVFHVLEPVLGLPITVAEEPQIVGAIGAAMFALDEVQAEIG